MVLTTLKIWISTGRKSEFIASIEYLHGRICLYPGFVDCGVYRDETDKSSFLVIERWKTWKDLHRYLRSDHYKKMLGIMELSNRNPKIGFNEIKVAMGMELIEEIRK